MMEMNLQTFGGRGSSGGKRSGGGGTSSAEIEQRVRELEQKADALERELLTEMSSTESRHSTGWREDMRNRIRELRDERNELLYGRR